MAQRKLTLVATTGPPSPFDDLEGLEAAGEVEANNLPTMPPAKARRPRTVAPRVGSFARWPHDALLDLYPFRIGTAAIVVLSEVDRAVFKSQGRNPIEFSSARLRQIGISGSVRRHAFEQ